jgi:hypothetical protein
MVVVSDKSVEEFIFGADSRLTETAYLGIAHLQDSHGQELRLVEFARASSHHSFQYTVHECTRVKSFKPSPPANDVVNSAGRSRNIF